MEQDRNSLFRIGLFPRRGVVEDFLRPIGVDRLVGAWIRGYLASLRDICLLPAALAPVSNLEGTRDDG